MDSTAESDGHFNSRQVENVSFCVYGRLTRLCTENVPLTTLNWHEQLQTVEDISQNIGQQEENLHQLKMPRHYKNDRMFMHEMKQLVSNASCSKFIPLLYFTTMLGLVNLPGLLSPQFLSIRQQVKKELLKRRPQLSVCDLVSVITSYV